MPTKDVELNFRGGPWENFSLTSSFKADKGKFELSGCGKPNRIVTVKCQQCLCRLYVTLFGTLNATDSPFLHPPGFPA